MKVKTQYLLQVQQNCLCWCVPSGGSGGGGGGGWCGREAGTPTRPSVFFCIIVSVLALMSIVYVLSV